MVDRRRLASLARRAVVFVLAYVVASALADRLLPDAAALAQKPAARKGGKKAKVEVDPCANFEFDMMPLNEEAGRGAARDVRIGALQSGSLSAANEAVFDAYYAEYQLPRLTQCKELNNLQRIAKEFKSDFGMVPSGPVRDRLNDLVLRVGQQIAQGNYHPASRFNAMLLIGELTSNEGDSATKAPPTPLPAALPVLLKTLTDEKSDDVVKEAALLGLDRHVTAGGVGAEAPRITAAMVALLSQKTPPADRSSDGHDWMRGQAANILGKLRGVGPKNEVVTALETVVADPDAAQSLRARAARALGSLDYTNAKQVDPSNVAAQIGSMAVTFYNQEKTQSNRLNQFPNRRLLKFWFQSAYTGLVGTGGADNKQSLLALAKASGDPHAKFVSELAAEMQTVANHEMFDTEYVEQTKLTNNFVELMGNVRKLEAYLKANRPKAAKPAAPAVPAAAPAGDAKTAAATPPAAAAPAPPAAAVPAAAAPATKQ